MAAAAGRLVSGASASMRDAKKHLLLDPRLNQESENAELRVGSVTKYPQNPVFGGDKPWEVSLDNVYANVMYDEQDRIFKCWYNPFIHKQKFNITPPEKRRRNADYRSLPENPVEMGVCYATSTDGLKWVKPELGLNEFEGSRRNNLVARSVVGPVSYPPIDPKHPLPPVVPARQSRDNWTPHGAGVWKDLGDKDPARRYKMFFSNPRKFLCVSFSADGLHWADPISCPQIHARGDTHNNATWAPELNRYVGFTRDFDYERQQRTVIRTESPDYVNWAPGVEVLRALPSEPRRQTYTMIVFPYGNVYLAWLMMINRDSSFHPDDPNDDTVDCELAFSADTRHWERVLPGHPIIPRGPLGSCDFGCLYGAAYPILHGGKLLLYYGGSDWKHTDWRNGSVCLATMRTDGFAGMEPKDRAKPGRIRTAEIPCLGRNLEVSADCSGGSLRVVASSADGKRVNSENVTQNVTNGAVQFSAGALDGMVGKPVRLEFMLEAAKLYAFRWS